MKQTTLRVHVALSPENIPQTIDWEADDAPGAGRTPCKAMLLALFDREHRETLKVDLWTHDMQVGEMDRFFYNTLRSMADTYYRATQNKGMANAMQQFAQFFGEQTEILPKSE